MYRVVQHCADPMTRYLAAIPDAITASGFLVLWLSPFAFGAAGVRNAMLVMLVEFILMHAAAALGGIVFKEDVTRAQRLRAIAATSVIYLLFVSVFAMVFKAWWPFVAFGWLLIGKFMLAFDPARTSAQRRAKMVERWAITAAAYVIGVFITVVLPLPRLGISAEVVPQLGLSGRGLWVEQPHTVIAFGVLYFGLLAWYSVRQAGAVVAGASSSRAAPS